MLYSSEAYAQGMWPRVNAYYSKTYLGYDMPLHRHVNAEVMYVFSGECVVDVEPDGKRRLRTRCARATSYSSMRACATG